MNYKNFIDKKIKDIKEIIGEEKALSVLSGGVDSSTVTLLGYKALGKNLKVVFVDNGLMRKGEPESVAKTFKKLGIKVEIVNAQNNFFQALKGKADPEEKRKAITAAFYKDIFRKIIREKKTKSEKKAKIKNHT